MSPSGCDVWRANNDITEIDYIMCPKNKFVFTNSNWRRITDLIQVQSTQPVSNSQNWDSTYSY